jgi:hypothetical protein
MAAHFTNNAVILYCHYQPKGQNHMISDFFQNISTEVLVGSLIAAVVIIALFQRLTRKRANAALDAVMHHPPAPEDLAIPLPAEPMAHSVKRAVRKKRLRKPAKVKKTSRHVRKRTAKPKPAARKRAAKRVVRKARVSRRRKTAKQK